jgi:trk system potassium uptake protein TrkA
VAIEVPPLLVGRQVRDLSVPGEVSVVVITRRGKSFVPLSGTDFHEDDLLHLAITSGAMKRVETLLGMGEGDWAK